MAMKTLELGHPSKMEFLSIIKDLVRVQNRIMDSLFIFKILHFTSSVVFATLCVWWGAVYLTGTLQEGVSPMSPETKTVWVPFTTQDLKFECMCPRCMFPCLHVPPHLFLPSVVLPPFVFPVPPPSLLSSEGNQYSQNLSSAPVFPVSLMLSV